MFIDFLYANLSLGVPPGMEDKVYPIKAFKGKQNVTGFYAFSESELAQINKTGGAWIGFMGHSWPPVEVNCWIPAHNPLPPTFQVYGDYMTARSGDGEGDYLVNIIPFYYLDLTILLLRVGPDDCDFMWKSAFTGETSIVDLEYREGTSPVKSLGKYQFSEPLEILGKFKDLDRLQPLGEIYPFLKTEEAAGMLVLMPKDKNPVPSHIIHPFQ